MMMQQLQNPAEPRNTMPPPQNKLAEFLRVRPLFSLAPLILLKLVIGCMP
jgi:hypothetical protein